MAYAKDNIHVEINSNPKRNNRRRYYKPYVEPVNKDITGEDVREFIINFGGLVIIGVIVGIIGGIVFAIFT